MRSFRLLGGLVYLAALGAACSEDGVSGLSLGLHVTQGLLDDATAVELSVLPGGGSCNASTGEVDGSVDQEEVQSFSLQREGCASGAVWCRDITLEQDGEARVFAIEATSAGETIARGCAEAVIDQDPVEVNIDVVAVVEESCCNDGNVQLLEQCDTGDPAPQNCAGDPVDQQVGSCGGIIPDAVCECDCLAREIPIAEASDDPAFVFENKDQLSFAFAGPAGDQGSTLRAVFTDFSDANSNNPPDINYRIYRPDLYPATDPFDQQLRLPTDPTSCNSGSLKNSSGRPLSQSQPDIARISGDQMAVAWADDSAQIGSTDVFALTVGPVGCAGTAPTQINVAKNNPLRDPEVAGGPVGLALAVWADGTAVRGRIWDPAGSTFLPADSDIDIATMAEGGQPRVAGSPNGWIVTYTGPANEGDVFIKAVDPMGTPGAEQRVNLVTAGAQDRPDVAMLPDGRFAIVWRSGEDAMFQRYDPSRTQVMGDQDETLTDQSPPADRPTIAASVDGGSFYAALWTTATDGNLWGRMIDADAGSTFLRNHVDGQTGDFLATHPAIMGQRRAPVVAVGSSHIAFGWVDDAPGTPSVFMRRFPHPPQ